LLDPGSGDLVPGASRSQLETKGVFPEGDIRGVSPLDLGSSNDILNQSSELIYTTNSRSIRIDYDKFNDYIRNLDIYF
jgi:hypothetical protein